MKNIVFLTDVNALGFIRNAGPYRLVTELRKNGYDVQVIDFVQTLPIDDVEKLFQKYITKDTIFVGVSMTFLTDIVINKDEDQYFMKDQLFSDNRLIDLCYRFKESTGTKFVLGGSRKQGTENFEKQYWNLFDVYVAGFADSAIVDIAKSMADGNYNRLKFKKSTIGSNSIYMNCYDDYAFDDFSTSKIVWQKNDILAPGENVPIETARGCIFKCAFCFHSFLAKKKFDYLKTKETLQAELIYNYENFGITSYSIMDDLLNDSREKCEIIHDVFTTLPFEIEYVTYARLDLFVTFPHTFELIAESGARGLQFGIETFNQEAGRAMGKGMSATKQIDALYKMKEQYPQVTLGSGFILGLPTETAKEMKWLIDWLAEDSCPLDYAQPEVLRIPAKELQDSNASSMAIDPEKYGYKDIGSENGWMVWDNGTMTTHDAMEIVQYAQEKIGPSSKKNKLFHTYTIPRLINMGWNFEDALDKIQNPTRTNLKEIIKRKRNLQKNYLSQLL